MELLGTAPDKQIAARLDCPVRTVTTKRCKPGIRAFRKQSKKELMVHIYQRRGAKG